MSAATKIELLFVAFVLGVFFVGTLTGFVMAHGRRAGVFWGLMSLSGAVLLPFIDAPGPQLAWLAGSALVILHVAHRARLWAYGPRKEL